MVRKNSPVRIPNPRLRPSLEEAVTRIAKVVRSKRDARAVDKTGTLLGGQEQPGRQSLAELARAGVIDAQTEARLFARIAEDPDGAPMEPGPTWPSSVREQPAEFLLDGPSSGFDGTRRERTAK